MKIQTLALALFAAATFAACSSMVTRPAMVSDGIITGNNGMTLYVFDKMWRAVARASAMALAPPTGHR